MFVKDNLSPGSDGAGEVWAIGESQFGGLQYQFKVGDRVAGNFTPLHINGGDVVSPNVMNSALGGPTDGVFSEWRVRLIQLID